MLLQTGIGGPRTNHHGMGKAANTAQHWSHVASAMESIVYLAPYSRAGVLSTDDRQEN